MKIGIITLYFDNPNYGGLLQAYALQKALSLLGYEAEQISYDLYEEYFDKFSHKKYLIKKCIKRLIPGFYSKNAIYNSKLKKFEKTIPHSQYVDSKSINILNDKYDAFLCGSDQIWNPIGWRPNFFLDFSKKPKIAYAPSIARDCLSENEICYIRNKTFDFKALSVRERNSSVLLSDLLDREIPVVPDPTLLLTKEEWEYRFPLSKKNNKPYIFAYFLGFNEIQRNECIKYAQRMGLDIKFVPYMKKDSYIWDKENITYSVKNFGVDGFIDAIRNAELVLTDSFHGTVFSCIFDKSFYVLDRQLLENEKSMNSRIDTLFFELCIPSDRIIKSTDELDDNYHISNKDRENIIHAKEKWREIGLNYLRESFE